MATWYQHALTTFDPETGLFSEDMKGLVDNFPAMAEGADNAYYLQSAWHPYNGTKVADGFTGLIYDFAVTGAVANVTTPDFVDGYEYRLRINGLVGTDIDPFRIELYQQALASFTSREVITAPTLAAPIWGEIEVIRPRITGVFFHAFSRTSLDAEVARPAFTAGVGFPVSSTKILRARLSPDAGNFTGGRVYMDKRRAY